MTISVVFDPPLPSDNPTDFNTKAFALLGDLNTWSTQANALPGEVATNLSALLAAPPAIGSTTPAAGSFTTLRSTVTLGYGTGAGAGGTVTQATSKSTAVTLNKACGQITMNNSAVGAGAEDGFYFYSDKLSANDVLIVTGQHDGTVNPANYEITVRQIYGPTNRALIYIKNRTAGSLSEAVVLNFVIIKGAAS